MKIYIRKVSSILVKAVPLKAAKKKLSFTEVPVKYRNRIGTSKVSGTVKGSILAGYKILFTIFKNI